MASTLPFHIDVRLGRRKPGLYMRWPEAILSACVFQENVVEDVVHSGQKMAEEALFQVK